MKAYGVSETATRDIEDIWLHIALDDPDEAEHQLEVFHAKFKLLARHPQAGRLRPELSPGIRSFAAGNYVILYREGSAGQPPVKIEHVFHGARDLKDAF